MLGHSCLYRSESKKNTRHKSEYETECKCHNVHSPPQHQWGSRDHLQLLQRTPRHSSDNWDYLQSERYGSVLRVSLQLALPETSCPGTQNTFAASSPSEGRWLHSTPPATFQFSLCCFCSKHMADGCEWLLEWRLTNRTISSAKKKKKQEMNVTKADTSEQLAEILLILPTNIINQSSDEAQP